MNDVDLDLAAPLFLLVAHSDCFDESLCSDVIKYHKAILYPYIYRERDKEKAFTSRKQTTII